jgi:hypothetical protein
MRFKVNKKHILLFIREMRKSRNDCRKKENKDECFSLILRRRRKIEFYTFLKYEAEMKQLLHKKRREVKFISE